MKKTVEYKPMTNAPEMVYQKKPSQPGGPSHKSTVEKWAGTNIRDAAKNRVRGTLPKSRKGM